MKQLVWRMPLLALLASAFIISCSDSSSDLVDYPEVDYEDILDLRTDDVDADIDELSAEFLTYDNGLRGRCITLVFPVTLVYPDGTTQEAGSLEELKDLLKEWKANSEPGDGRPHLQLPFEVETKDGEIVTVESKEDLLALKKDCVRDHKRRVLKRCFELVYPVNVVLPNGDVIEIESKEQMMTFLHRWKKAHRGADHRPRIELPFEVELEDGTIYEINSREDLKKALEDCRD
ncbi:MAG: hypothetical protein R3275_12040 [Saprospiraceae bacterium]|nr:hypothetical protein [Saprospiraceae bacterium]